MIDASKLPAVPRQVALAEQQRVAVPAPQYARAPSGPATPAPGARPPATSGGSR